MDGAGEETRGTEGGRRTRTETVARVEQGSPLSFSLCFLSCCFRLAIDGRRESGIGGSPRVDINLFGKALT